MPELLYPLVPTEQKTGWDPQLVWTLWRREKSLAPARNQSNSRRTDLLVTELLNVDRHTDMQSYFYNVPL
jgi:hypothetical protein